MKVWLEEVLYSLLGFKPPFTLKETVELHYSRIVRPQDNEAETLEKESSPSLHAVRDVAPAAVSC